MILKFWSHNYVPELHVLVVKTKKKETCIIYEQFDCTGTFSVMRFQLKVLKVCIKYRSQSEIRWLAEQNL